MKFPRIKGRRWPIGLLLFFGLLIVFAVIISFNLSKLVAPRSPITPISYQDTQLLSYNVATKAKVGFFSMLQSGTGRGTIELTEAEVNALLSQGLSGALKGDYKFIGATTRLLNGKIYVSAAVNWQGLELGPQFVFQPGVINGDLVLVLRESKLGLLPLPQGVLNHYLALRSLPPGFQVLQTPLRLTYDPDILINQVNLPLIKNPHLTIINIQADNHKLFLTTALFFQIGF